MKWLAWLSGRFQSEQRSNSPLNISGSAEAKLCKALRADGVPTVQDLLNCLLLSECVYKAHDLGQHEAVKSLRLLQETFPPGLTNLQAVQCSLPHVHHRYLVATSPNTIYVSFIGTKLAKDILVDANVLHRPLWQLSESSAASPAAHRGFLARARRVPVEQLLAHAQKTNRKLLLCGHSLGGAVANLCTLRVLQQAADADLPRPPVKCITFGTPAIGNSALASRVVEKGWKDCFQNVILPEDLVPRLLAVNPDASTAELDVEPEELDFERRPQGSWRRLPNPGFASRLNAFRRPQMRVQSVQPHSPAEMQSSQLDPAGLKDPPESAHSLAASNLTMGGHAARVWALPQRLWRKGEGQSPVLSLQDSNTLPPRANEAATQREARNPQQLSAELQAEEAAVPSRLGSALHAVGRRMPLQGWWGANGQSEDEGLSMPASIGNSEDGAVDALVNGPAPDPATGQASEKLAANRMTWLSRLAQLQGIAASAASTVGGVGGQLLPTYVHFGQTLVWTAVEQAPSSPVAFPTNDIRSRVLANHRMPAYRLRALAHCAETPGLPAPQPGSSGVYLSEDVLPRVVLHRATADLQPLSPTDPSANSQSRWSWIPYVGGESSSQLPELTVQIHIDGEGLSSLRQGRMLAYASTWCPVRIMDNLSPSVVNSEISADAQASSNDQRSFFSQTRVVEWLQKRFDWSGEASLLAEARLPGAVASQVYHGHSSPEPALELHLRSDFAQVTVPVSVRVPTVWLIGSSAAATRRLMSALSTQSPIARPASALPVQPAELVLDGTKWCNLLAAPVTTPSLAVSALTTALPARRMLGPEERTGPIRLANSMLQGLQAWLVGPQINLRDGASSSAIVLAVDKLSALHPRQLTKLSFQAERAGIRLLVLCMGEEAKATTARRNGPLQQCAVAVLEEEGGVLKPESVMALRQEIFRALSGPAAQQPLSKL